MNDFIEEYPNTLSQIDCRRIISWFENSKDISLGKVGDGVIDISKKDIRFLNERLQNCPWQYRRQFLRIYANPILNRDSLDI